MGNGLLTPMCGEAPGAEAPQLTLRLERTTLDQILAQHTSFPEAIGSGAVTVESDITVLATFHSLLGKPRRNVPIVLP
ncbi:alkyl sulfatase C-terminal domain-containing protein [Streptomyces sp. NPDC057681]|uniref:alkyl sulfatase C-terminal domain-containing protein n=1 Tax=Streptomyces sp. NPDC057681 TaxID=3346209 RepID=UPI0036C2BDA6